MKLDLRKFKKAHCIRLRSLRSGSLEDSGRNLSTSASRTSSCLASLFRRPGSVSRMCVVSCSLSVRCRNGVPSLSAMWLQSAHSYEYNKRCKPKERSVVGDAARETMREERWRERDDANFEERERDELEKESSRVRRGTCAPLYKKHARGQTSGSRRLLKASGPTRLAS